MDGTDRIGCLTSVLDLSVQLGRDIKEVSPDISFPRFSSFLLSFLGEREGGPFYADTSVYVKLEEISVTRNFVCMMSRDVFFFILFFFSLRDEYWRRGFLDVKGVMGKMWDMRRGRMLAMRGI